MTKRPTRPAARQRPRRPRGEGTIYFDAVRRRYEGQIYATDKRGITSRRKVTGATEEAVRDKLRKIAVDASENKLVANAHGTVGKFLEGWVTNILPGTVAPSTERQYADVVRLYITPHIGTRRLSSLKPSDVTKMVRTLTDSGLSPNTARTARSVLRRALRSALADGDINSNVAVTAQGVRVPPADGRTMTFDEARTFLDSIADHRLAAAWTTALGLGLRLGELLGLAWGDLDLDASNPTVTIARALKRVPNAGLELSEPKTRTSRRTVFLPSPVAVALRQHRRRQTEERLAAGPEWVASPLGHDLVFRTEFGTAIDPANFRHYTYRVTAQAGLGRWTPHELRHSAASLLIAMGVPLKVVSETLGHSSIRITADVYGHLLDESRIEAARAMERALGGGL